MPDSNIPDAMSRDDGGTQQIYPKGHANYPAGATVINYPPGHSKYRQGARVTVFPPGDPEHRDGAEVTEYPVGDLDYPLGAVVVKPLSDPHKADATPTSEKALSKSGRTPGGELKAPAPAKATPPSTPSRHQDANDPAGQRQSRADRVAGQRESQQTARRVAAAQAAAAALANEDAKNIPDYSISVTAPDGSPIPVVTADQPFVVTVKLPANATAPSTIDVTFTTSAGEKHLTVVNVSSGPNGFIYRSDPITLAHGGAGGDTVSILPGTSLRLEFPWGGVGAISSTEGEDVGVSFTSYGSGGTTKVQAFSTVNKATIYYGEAYIVAFDTMVRNILIALQHGPDTPATRQLRQWAEGKWSIIEAWHELSNNPQWGDLERARFVTAYVDGLKGCSDVRDSNFTQFQDRAVREIRERYQGAFNVFLKEFVTSVYELFIGNLPLVAPLWTLFTGTDIFGRHIEGWEYVMTVLDAAGQAAMLALPFAIVHETSIPGSTPRRPSAALEKPPAGPVTRAPAGTFIKNVNEIGLTVEQAKSFNRAASVAVAEEAEQAAKFQGQLRFNGDTKGIVEPRFREAHLQFRPMDPGVVERVRQGCALKGEAVKAKTTNATDIKGGWAKTGTENKVGFYPEKLIGEKVGIDFTAISDKTLEEWSVKSPPPPPGVNETVWKRAIQRAKEFRDEKVAIAKYTERGLMHVDENNLVVNDGICDYKIDPKTHELIEIPGTQKGTGMHQHITGDPDGWAFFDEHGQPLPREVCIKIIERLHKAGVKHDLVTEWDIEHDPHYTPEEKAKNIGIRDKILGSHQGEPQPDGSFGPKPGTSGVADFGGLTTPRSITYGDAPISPQVPQRSGVGGASRHLSGEWNKGPSGTGWIFRPLVAPPPPPEIRTPDDAADGIMEGLIQMGRVPGAANAPAIETHEPTADEKMDELRGRLKGEITTPDTRETSNEWESKRSVESPTSMLKQPATTTPPAETIELPREGEDSSEWEQRHANESSSTSTVKQPATTTPPAETIELPREGEDSTEWEQRHEKENVPVPAAQGSDRPGVAVVKKLVNAVVTPVGALLIVGGAALGTLSGIPVTSVPTSHQVVGSNLQTPSNGGLFVRQGQIVSITNAPTLVEGGFTNSSGGLTGTVVLTGDPHLWQEHQNAGTYQVVIRFDNGQKTITVTYVANGGATIVNHTGFNVQPAISVNGGTINVTAGETTASTFSVNVTTQLTYDVAFATASLGGQASGATNAPVGTGGTVGVASGASSGVTNGGVGALVGVAMAVGIASTPIVKKKKKKDCSKQKIAYAKAQAKAQSAQTTLTADQAADQKAIAAAQAGVDSAQQSVTWAQQLVNSFDSQGNWNPPTPDPSNPPSRPTFTSGHVRYIEIDPKNKGKVGASSGDVHDGAAGQRPMNANDAQNSLNQAQDQLATAQANLAAAQANAAAKEAADARSLASANAAVANALAALKSCEAANA